MTSASSELAISSVTIYLANVEEKKYARICEQVPGRCMRKTYRSKYT